MALVPVAPHEVYFGDTYFPIKGPVRWTNITVTANPTLFGSGDKKGDTQVMSEQIQDSWTGGRGIFKNDARTDIDRYWTSTCKTWQREALTLPDLSVDMGKPDELTTENVDLIWTYRNEEYFAFSNKVYRWLDATSSWSEKEHELDTVPTDAIVFNNTLYVAFGSGYATRDTAGNWTDLNSTPATYWVVWDTKLYRLAEVNNVWTMYSMQAGGSWSMAEGTMPDDVTPQGMVVYRDGDGLLVIYVITNSGLWVYDADNNRFLQTEIRFPPTTDPVRGAVFVDGKLYMGTGGLGVLGIQAGSQLIATPLGLDLEDAVPSEQLGKIVNMKAAYNEIVVYTDASTPDASEHIDSGLGNPFEPHAWTSSQGLLTIWRFDGQSWHCMWQEATTQPGTALNVSSAYSTLRVYWAAHGHAYYQKLQATTHNPRANPTVAANPSCIHVSSWYSFGIETQLKIHGHLIVRTSGCSPTETVAIYYGKDLSEDWIHVGTITTNGQHVFQIGGPEGESGYYFRYKLELSRGDTNTNRPVVEFMSAEWMRVLPATYGYSFDVDLTKEWRGKSPAQLTAALERLADHRQTPKMQLFSYQDQLDNTTKTHYGRITRMAGATESGRDIRGEGMAQVSVIVPYLEDSESP